MSLLELSFWSKESVLVGIKLFLDFSSKHFDFINFNYLDTLSLIFNLQIALEGKWFYILLIISFKFQTN